MDTKHAVTAKAHANIAIIKYWGKKNEELKIPWNSSISFTLDAFFTTTSFQPYDKDTFILNGEIQDEIETRKVFEVVNIFRKDNAGILIKSNNSMPTAAGLSSSSSGLAALVICANSYFKTGYSDSELSRIARLGSGSACRSLYGPFAIWKSSDNDKDAIAYPVQCELDLSMAIVVLSDKKKTILSRNGMKNCVETSSLFPTWVKQANKDAEEMLLHIKNKNFSKMGELMERNTLLMHETTKYANPPFTYLKPETFECITFVKKIRANGIPAYFTMDAGPNVKILCETENIEKLKKMLLEKYSEQQIVITKGANQYVVYEGDHVI